MKPLAANPQGKHQASALGVETARQSTPNLLHRYVFWTYERGSFHYDVMVTLILLFLFFAPHFIDFHDRPIPEVPARSSEVLVRAAGMQGQRHKLVYEIRAEDLHDVHTDADLDARIAEKVNNITPGAEISSIKPVKDPRGRTVGYDATVLR